MEKLALIWLHVTGNIVWIGSILAVATVILSPGGASKSGGQMALAIYRRLAVPAFLLSFVCGAVRLGLDLHLYLKVTHWMHAKLPLALAVIGIGIIAVARATGTGLGWSAVGPIALTVLAGLGWAFGNIGNRLAATDREPGTARPGDALRLVLWMSVIPPLPFLAMSLVFDGPTAGIDALADLGSHSGLLALAGLAYIVLLGTIAGSGLWADLIARYPASRVAPMSLLVPVVGITAAWLFFGEIPSAAELLGAAAVISGCTLGVLSASHTPTSRVTEKVPV